MYQLARLSSQGCRRHKTAPPGVLEAALCCRLRADCSDAFRTAIRAETSAHGNAFRRVPGQKLLLWFERAFDCRPTTENQTRHPQCMQKIMGIIYLWLLLLRHTCVVGGCCARCDAASGCEICQAGPAENSTHPTLGYRLYKDTINDDG